MSPESFSGLEARNRAYCSSVNTTVTWKARVEAPARADSGYRFGSRHSLAAGSAIADPRTSGSRRQPEEALLVMLILKFDLQIWHM